MVGTKLIRRIGMSAATQQQQMNKTKKISPSVDPKPKSNEDESYDYFFNSVNKRRRPSMLREINYIMSQMPADTILFGVGMPNVSPFPFQSINITLKDGSGYNLEGKDLHAALQYLPSKGYSPLVHKLRAFIDKVHGKQDWDKRDVLVTAGAQEGLCTAIEMSLNEGDSIIIPSPFYAGVVDMLKPYALRYITVPQDKNGMRPDVLYDKLIEAEKDGTPIPKLMYTNPTACNPTGVNISNSRKREIYQLACEYNFLILEDDPYYFLHFGNENPESFLSMDTENRVLRFDSFSKVMSSGLRLGFVTAPSVLLRKIELHLQVSTLHTSALSQVMVYKLIDKWGLDQLIENFNNVKEFYKIKRDHMLAACNKHLKNLAEWNVPDGGMFLWLRIEGVDDTYKLVMEDCIKENLLIVPGHLFYIQGEDNCVYIRLSYSLPSTEQMDEGCARLASIIRKKQR